MLQVYVGVLLEKNFPCQFHMFHGTGRFTDLYAIHAGFFLDVQSHGNIWESRVAAWSAATHLAKRTGSDSSAW